MRAYRFWFLQRNAPREDVRHKGRSGLGTDIATSTPPTFPQRSGVMKSKYPITVCVIATLILCTGARTQMLVSPLPGQGPPTLPPPVVGCSVGPCGPALREPILRLDAEAVAEAGRFRQVRVPGNEVHHRISTLLRKLTWHANLKRAARAARRTGRPILWIQALGNLRSYT